jgi:hypothetical protein
LPADKRGHNETGTRGNTYSVVANVSKGGKERRKFFERERRKFESVLVKTGNVW